MRCLKVFKQNIEKIFFFFVRDTDIFLGCVVIKTTALKLNFLLEISS